MAQPGASAEDMSASPATSHLATLGAALARDLGGLGDPRALLPPLLGSPARPTSHQGCGDCGSPPPTWLSTIPFPVPALTFPLGPLGSRQVAKMCWGGRGLAASCLTSSSPMPRLDPVTRTLRASAAMSPASAPGGDTWQGCRLLGGKRSPAQPRVWLWAPTGTGTVPAPAPSPAPDGARLPGGPRPPSQLAQGAACHLHCSDSHHSAPLKPQLPESL